MSAKRDLGQDIGIKHDWYMYLEFQHIPIESLKYACIYPLTTPFAHVSPLPESSSHLVALMSPFTPRSLPKHTPNSYNHMSHTRRNRERNLILAPYHQRVFKFFSILLIHVYLNHPSLSLPPLSSIYTHNTSSFVLPNICFIDSPE
ncbi:hypothetical protein K435DRAFT_969667 [Dendrothele bispora CBS 962.96]|uniref:Uncharacterized protein n=1 Tax=Dendrothele bispora (strain CBS 962.96) TaxID=1314807 RepID=A0A4S8LGI6_DENBC|nr:hypothetical protein K435DRAFT_969667 [Dendrothele bispora CBS 962.96]